jgi:thioesterase domain-containing protein
MDMCSIFEISSWGNFTSKEFVIYDGAGVHGDMIENENLQKNLEIIRMILERISEQMLCSN